ncbi:replication protein P [Superficieibacter sp. 1612_C1]|uniref:replication protein P n=1 Tax=Superficieibacter sp. 1612_C1 TaxID=2780382 RepID=UPI0018842055|nr:replication protein P [Superficieibacter sp. 1612_C1]
MKTFGEQLQNFDRENMRRMAHGMPEIQDEPPEAEIEKTAAIFNALFTQLKVTFPAVMAAIRTQEDLNEFRRQWLLAFGENGITSIEQVNAGMRIARRQEKPFMPSPGQFVAWCREGRGPLGISSQDVMDEFWKWRKLVFRYPTSEQYPWSQPVMYHICLELRRRGVDRQMTEKELFAEAGELLGSWERRVASGKPIPPVRRALAAPAQAKGPTPAEIMKAEYDRRKAQGRI